MTDMEYTMSECTDCGYTDIREDGTDCPMCDDGTMEVPEGLE